MLRLRPAKFDRAFTLTELMLVAGVILLLLIPLAAVAEKTYKKSEALKCLNNLRHIAQGIELYTIKNRYVPLDGWNLREQLADCVDSEGAFTCPCAPEPDEDSYSACYVQTGPWGSSDTPYVLNCRNHTDSNLSVFYLSKSKGGLAPLSPVTTGGKKLDLGEKVKGSGKVIQFAEGSSVELLDNSAQVELVQSARITDYPLQAIVRQTSADGTPGQIRVKVTPGTLFNVLTPAVVVGVRGTEFTVTVGYNGIRNYSTVSVISGAVMVHADSNMGGFRLLGPGQSMTGDDGDGMGSPSGGDCIVAYGGQNYYRSVRKSKHGVQADYWVGVTKGKEESKVPPYAGKERWELRNDIWESVKDTFTPNN